MCTDKGLTPRSDEDQPIIHKHYERFYDVLKDVYTGLAQLYCEHPDFKKYYETHYPKMAEFLAEGMRVYAQKNLV